MDRLLFFIESLYFGFGVFNVVAILIGLVTKKVSRFPRISRLSDYVIVWGGLAYLILLGYHVFTLYLLTSSADSQEEIVLSSHTISGWHMIHLVVLGLGSQLFRLDRIRNNYFIRFILALAFFSIIKFEDWVIFITSLHRDYLPADQSISGNFLLDCLVQFLFFWGALGLCFLISENNKPEE